MSVEVAVPETVGVTLVDENAQVVSFGRVPQLKVVALAKPLMEVTVIVVTAGVPGLNEPLEGENATEKLGGPGQTVTVAAEDVEDALFASPP